MDTKNVDQNLMFALLALKMGLIDNEAMVTGLNAWSARKYRSVGQTLVAQEAFSEARLFLVEQTFSDLLESSGGDPHLGTVSLRLPAGLVETNLERIADVDLRAALARLEGAEVAGRAVRRAIFGDRVRSALTAGSIRPSPARADQPASASSGPATQQMTVDQPAVTERESSERRAGPVTEPGTASLDAASIGLDAALRAANLAATELPPGVAAMEATMELSPSSPSNGGAAGDGGLRLGCGTHRGTRGPRRSGRESMGRAGTGRYGRSQKGDWARSSWHSTRSSGVRWHSRRSRGATSTTPRAARGS